MSIPVGDDLIIQAIFSLSSVRNVTMDPDALTEDIALLAVAFPDEPEFLKAVNATMRAMTKVAEGRVASSPALVGDHAGWTSYHYQHCVAQGQKADIRLEWRPCPSGGILVRAFDHRFIPADFYRRISASRKG